MKIAPLRKTDLDGLLGAMNRTLEDYLIPARLDAQRLRFLLEVEDVQLPLSSWILDEGRPVAFALVGLRSELGRTSPIGVDGPYRGRGLARRLLRHSLNLVAEAGADAVEVEVLQNNLPALKLYEGAGFFIKRDLLCFRRPAGRAAGGDRDSGIVSLPGEWLLERFDQYHPTRPPWQRAPVALARRLSRCRAVGLGNPREPRAFLVHDGKRIHDAWFEAGIEPEAAERFLNASAPPDVPLTILNVPAEDPLARLLERLGWECFLKQYEMRYDVMDVA
jgi:ribosomal protein S18 acetylase RimI-like enzyme